MNEHDAHIDDALEAVARPEPPADHVARVLARTGSAVGRDGSPSRPSVTPLRWALPVAVSVLVAAGVTWSLRDVTLPAIQTSRSLALSDVEGESRPYQPWGTPRELERPVLPPQAYWGMDAFEEWRTLRPGTGQRAPATWATSGHRQPAAGNRQLTDQPSTPTTAPAPRRLVDVESTRLAYAPLPSGLPPIELESIAPAPLAFEPLAEPAPVDLPAITFEPIVIAPLEEERP